VGCLPTYQSVGIAAPIALICLRILQGLSAGGEYTGALTYVAEYSPSGRRGLNMSWTTASSTAGLLLSFLVILTARVTTGSHFDEWGWRLPFAFALIMLIISVALRVRMHESPAFQKLRSANKLSKAPVRETFLDPANQRRLLVAFALCAGMTSMYYMASLYPTFFLTKTLKVGATTVNTLVLLATAICLPVFPLAGWLCDRWGRKAVLIAGFVATLVLVFPVFYGLLAYANPALAAAQAKADIRVETDLAGCSLMFNPLGNRKFTSACDTARQALASASVAYRVTQTPVMGNAARIRIGDTVLEAYDATGLPADEAKARASRLASTLRTALDQYGYPASGTPADVNKVMVLVLLVAFFASSKELRRANEILKTASAFFAQAELDRRLKS